MGWPVTLRDPKLVAQQTLTRYMDGERIDDIAKQYGVTNKRLYQVMAEHEEEAWKAAQMAAAIQRLEEAKQGLDAATDMLDIARARESARIAQWELERVCKRIYGTDDVQSVLGQGLVQINISLSDKTAPKDVTPDSQVLDSK